MFLFYTVKDTNKNFRLYVWAVLKGDAQRVTLSIPKSFLKDVDSRLKKFALTDSSRWLLEAAKKKLAQEKNIAY